MSTPIKQSHPKRGSSKSSERSRAAVIDAAIHCLATEGYQGATSNRIARQAGLSWGVIQYHFGDRAGIYRAVLDATIDGYVIELDQLAALSPGLAPEQRLRILAEKMWALLDHPGYLASIELLHNLPRDPNMAIDSHSYAKKWGERIAKLWQAVFPEFPVRHKGSAQARQIFFAALRGFVENKLIGRWSSRTAVAPLLVALATSCAVLLETPPS